MIYVLPIILVILFIYCLIKKIPAYDYFVKGAKTSFDLVLSIFPYLVAIFIFIELMNVSAVGEWLTTIFKPVLQFLGIPPELTELIILRPFSGSGSLAMLQNIYTEYGADSLIGRSASVVVGASDTIFFVVSVYFSTVKIKKFRYLLPVCLTACFIGSLSACWLVRLFS